MSYIHQPLIEEVRAQSIKLLNQNLANSIDLYSQFKSALWNVHIAGSINFKKQLEVISKSVLKFEDIIGERINSLGGIAYGNIQFASSNSILVPYNISSSSQNEHGFAIAASLAAYSQAISSALYSSNKIHDFTTSDVFAKILRLTDAAIVKISLQLDVCCIASSNGIDNRNNTEPYKKSGDLDKIN